MSAATHPRIEGDATSAIVPLSGLVSRANGTPFGDEGDVCDYTGSLSSSMTMRGVVDSSAKLGVWRVGVRAARANIPRPAAGHRIDSSMPIVEEVRRAVQQMGSRSSAMPVTWERMDLFGVVRRLAMGATFYATWGALTAVELRGGGNASVASIASVIEPIAADNGAVFVSGKLVGHSRPNIMAALVNAVSGEGGTLYTDLLGVNAGGAVQVPNAQDAALAQGCHEALRLFGAMFKACQQGEFFALAVSQGVHRIASVYGHSDEGAYTRDVFRATEAGVPYGALILDLDPDNALPNPQRSVAGFRAVYHGIGIATAGAVALADPMVDYHGRDYPTILVTDQGNVVDPGEDNAGDAADAADLSTQWAESCGAFSELYSRALGEIFVTSGGSSEVQRHLVSQANSLAGQDNRHLRQKVAVAFWWVEPTCACPVGDETYPAFTASHGPLALSMKPRSVPALDGCALLENRSDHSRSTIQVDLRYLRRHGLFVHLTTHLRNGMGNIILETGVVNDCLLVGGAGNLGPRILAGNTLNTYQWGRGLSAVVAGGEFISLSKSNVITLAQLRPPNNGVIRNTHLPTGTEAVEGEVVYRASRLVGEAPGPPGAAPARNVRRARARAAISLSMAADAHRQEYIINDQLMQPSLVDFGDLPPNTRAVREPLDEEGEVPGDGANDPANPVLPDGAIDGRGGPAPVGAQVNGPNAPLRIEQQRDRGPRAPRPGRIGGTAPPGAAGGRAGGGGAPIPPVGGAGGPNPGALPPGGPPAPVPPPGPGAPPNPPPAPNV